MREYELTLVIDPEVTSENQKKLIAKFKKLIEDLKGKVKKIDEWGKKELAYPIKKKKMGFYFLCDLELAEDKAKEVDNKLKTEEEILRFLIIKKDN